MQLLVDQFEKFAAAAVLQPAAAPITDAQFLSLCAQYPDYRVETTAEGDILIMPPAAPSNRATKCGDHLPAVRVDRTGRTG